MRSFNKVMLHGNLTSDPEIKTAKNGNQFSTFSLATNLDWKNKEGEMVSQTDFHRVVAFGRLGEITGQYLKKGSPVIVTGRLSNRSYLTKEGAKRYITEVVLDDFNFMSSGRKKKDASATATTQETLEEAVAA